MPDCGLTLKALKVQSVTESLWYQWALAVGAAQFGGTKFFDPVQVRDSEHTALCWVESHHRHPSQVDEKLAAVSCILVNLVRLSAECCCQWSGV